MIEILIKSTYLMLIIFTGYIFKRMKVFRKQDGNLLSQIIIYVTLPSTIIVNLNKTKIELIMLTLIIIAILWTIFQILLAHKIYQNRETTTKSFMIFMGSGFNVGNFLLPFLQTVAPNLISLISIFDIGNSVMLTGGTQAFVSYFESSKNNFSLVKLSKGLIRSLPFMCYLIMFVIKFLELNLPQKVIAFFIPIANANTFLSMFMIGLFLELNLPKTSMKQIISLYKYRYITGGVFVLIINLLPINLDWKMVLSLLSLSPTPLFGVINSIKAGVKEEIVGFTSSFSFIISLLCMTLLMMVYKYVV